MTVTGIWQGVAKWAIRKLIELPPKVSRGVQEARLLIRALVVVAISIAVIFLVVYIWTRVSPRVPQLFHSAAFDEFIAAHNREVIATLTSLDSHLSADLGVAGVSADLAELKKATSELLLRNLEADLASHLKYHDAVVSMDFMARQDLKANGTQFCTEGDLDADILDEFRKGMVKNMATVGKCVGAISQALDESEDPGDMSEGAVALASDVHKLRLLLGYTDDINVLYKTRGNNVMTMAVWTVYFVPSTKVIYTQRLPEVWKRAPPAFVASMKSGMTWWGQLGLSLMMIPCNMAWPDPVDRAAHCSGAKDEGFEGFRAGLGVAARLFSSPKKERKATEDDGEGEDVVEGMSIGGFLKAVFSLVVNVATLGMAIAHIGSRFAEDPFGAIVSIFTLIIGTIVGILLVLLYLLLTITGSFFVLLFVWGFVSTFGWAMVVSVYYVLYTVIIAVVYFLLWIPDMITGGAVSKLMRCENLPDDWMHGNGFADGNVWERLGLGCWGPCARRRDVELGCLCRRKKGCMPDYCPQQQIARIFMERKVGPSEPYVFTTFPAPTGFGAKTLVDRQKAVVASFADKKRWYQSCYTAFDKYDYLNKHVCSHLTKKGALGLDQATTDKLRALCKECYCDYKPATTYLGSLDAELTALEERAANPFCKRRADDEVAVLETAELPEGKAAAILKLALMIGVLVILVLSVLYSMFGASDAAVAAVTFG